MGYNYHANARVHWKLKCALLNFPFKCTFPDHGGIIADLGSEQLGSLFISFGETFS